MVVVVLDDGSGVKLCEISTFDWQSPDETLAVDVEELVVARPVRCFKQRFVSIDDLPFAALDVECFQARFTYALFSFFRDPVGERHIGDECGFQIRGVVSADSDSDQYRIRHRHLDRADGLERAAGFRGGYREDVAIALELDRRRREDWRSGGERCSALGHAVLQLDQAIAVDRHINIGRIRVERLAHHRTGLAMRLLAFGFPTDVHAEDKIAGNLLVEKLERVLGEPDVFATAGDAVLALVCEKFRRCP